jgi:hypothetical protein
MRPVQSTATRVPVHYASWLPPVYVKASRSTVNDYLLAGANFRLVSRIRG